MIARLILQRDPFVALRPTTGTLAIAEGEVSVRLCRTIELPWMNNAKGSSCIPAGAYGLAFTHSPRYNRRMWRVLDVPGRDGILIHPANYIRQLRGCIAPGVSLKDIDGDGMIDAVSSGAAMAKLLEALKPYEATGLRIVVMNAPMV